MWLSWRWGLAITIVMASTGLVMRRRGVVGGSRTLVDELGLMFGLYTLWRICGRLSVMGVEGALDRGRDLWRLERWLHLPDELTMQGWVLPHGWLVQASNIYYAAAHAPGLGIFLVWLFFRRREQYGTIRTAFVLLTFSALVVELVPVAPPRLLPELGFVDTAHLYGQSVYASAIGPDSFNQLSAMPSVHVGWAVVVGWYTWRLTTSRWRWLAVGHAVATVFVVTVTANHWLVDGVAAVLLLAGGHAVAGAWARRRATAPLADQMVGRSDVNATTSTTM